MYLSNGAKDTGFIVRASLANQLFCVEDPGGEPPRIPEKPICIHSLSACTFPVVIIHIKHYPIFSTVEYIIQKLHYSRT